MSYANLIKNIEDDTFYVGGGVSDEMKIECENLLKIKFPKEYKNYISECGFIAFGDSILLGLDFEGENDERGTVLGDTLFAREEFSLDKEFVVIEYEDYENLYALKCSSDVELDDSPVFSFEIDYNNQLTKPVKISDSFKEHFHFFVESNIE